jgi:hypothetical protein
MDTVEGGIGTAIEVCEPYEASDAGEVSIRVEVPPDIKGKIPKAISFPPVNTEPEAGLLPY